MNDIRIAFFVVLFTGICIGFIVGAMGNQAKHLAQELLRDKHVCTTEVK